MAQQSRIQKITEFRLASKNALQILPKDYFHYEIFLT